MPDPRYNSPDVVTTEVRKKLVQIERDLQGVVHDLHELYVYHTIDNRLANDVLRQTRELICQVRQRLRPD